MWSWATVISALVPIVFANQKGVEGDTVAEIRLTLARAY